ncbi:aromatic ring-hydroxylating oxygenase subunit alpha [Yoonia sp. 2307UL14-13]|uniref:aromatic ring-hydroxylating oxygenase subunit alpha n=1 Tax=Yoonia sp. 2307UL14-13 TaxID=3126506 RepID=UPI00309E517B
MNSHDPLGPVMQPINRARGLPNAHYIDQAVFDAEKRRLLFANWAGIGFAHDVAEPSDAKPVDFLGMPLLILRDRAGVVRVFQNTCRHRGMILVDTPGKIRGAIRCPYHSWCYDLDGTLKSTPHVGGPGHNRHEDIDMSTLGLIEIASYVWQGVVFANIDGSAPPFTKVHADLLTRWREFDQPLHFGGETSYFALDVATNWKLAVENYCESYHLPWIHPGLNTYSRLEDHYNITAPGKFSGQGTLVYRQLCDDGKIFSDFAGLPDKWNEGAEYIAVYPNVLLGVQRDHTFAIVLEPKSCDQTVEHVALFYADDAADNDLKDKNADLWRGVFEEDLFVVEGMQRGRHGIKFDGGRFSPVMDGPTHNFHDWVARQMANRG